MYRNRSETSNPSLARSYYRPYLNVVTTRGGESGLSSALDVYSNGDYKQALAQLNQQASSDTTLFYSGVCYISLDKPDSALQMFDRINDASMFHQQARWYSAIAFLLKDDPKAAANSLEQIESQQFKYPEGRELLEKIAH